MTALLNHNTVLKEENDTDSGLTFRTGELLGLLEKYKLMPQLMRAMTIEQATAAIAVDPSELAATRQTFFAQRNLTQPELQDLWLTRQGVTQTQLDEQLAQDLKTSKFKQEKWGNYLKSYFLRCKDGLDRVVYSLLRTQDLNVAHELYFRIQAGEATFAEVASEYSQGAEAQTGGLVGPVELSRTIAPLAEILNKSQEGQLWQPVQLGEWAVIIRLEQRISAKLDAAMEQRLLDELFDSWLQAEVLRRENELHGDKIAA